MPPTTATAASAVEVARRRQDEARAAHESALMEADRAAVEMFGAGTTFEAVTDRTPDGRMNARAGQFLAAHRPLFNRIREAAVEADRAREHLEGVMAAAYGTDPAARRHGDPGSRSAHATRSGRPTEVWAAEAAAGISSMVSTAGIVSGSIDTPTLVDPNVQTNPENPARIIDLLGDRRPLDSNAFEFLRQTVRNRQAAPVADDALKPTSVFTMTSVEDRARVIAHLTEPVPIRMFDDHDQVEAWLASELAEGVLDALEAQVVDGDGLGENFTGILNTTGVTIAAWAGEKLATIRRARTIMQGLHESPTGWVLSPDDAESFDMEREGTNGTFMGGTGLSNVFGPHPIVVSTSLDAGTALLADWRAARLYVREGLRLDVDTAGDLFKRNQAQLRGEGRFGLGVLRPQAFAVVNLTAPTV